MVNNGKNAQTITAVDNARLPRTSLEARRIRCAMGKSAFAPLLKCRYMFSTMITEESTMMPKSTAPMDNKFADLPRTKSTDTANISASGTLMATISAVRTLLRNSKSTTVTSPMPASRFSRTVPVVTAIR